MFSKKHLIKLSPGELEIMEMLWSEDGVFLSQAHQFFLQRDRKIGYTTVQTRLNRLVEKGIVLRDDESYPGVYKAVLKREQITGRYFDLLEELCGGNLAPLMIHLLKKQKFSPKELDALKSVLDDQIQRDSRTKNRGKK